MQKIFEVSLSNGLELIYFRKIELKIENFEK